jgi:hypothetical protein
MENTMNAQVNVLQARTTTRLAGFVAALVLSVGTLATLTQAMHIDRLGHGAPLVELEAVVVTPAKTTSTELARAEEVAVKRQTN